MASSKATPKDQRPYKPTDGVCPVCSRTNESDWRFHEGSQSWCCRRCKNAEYESRGKPAEASTSIPNARNTPRPEGATCPRCGSLPLVHEWKWDADELRWVCAKCRRQKQRAGASWVAPEEGDGDVEGRATAQIPDDIPIDPALFEVHRVEPQTQDQPPEAAEAAVQSVEQSQDERPDRPAPNLCSRCKVKPLRPDRGHSSDEELCKDCKDQPPNGQVGPKARLSSVTRKVLSPEMRETHCQYCFTPLKQKIEENDLRFTHQAKNSRTCRRCYTKAWESEKQENLSKMAKEGWDGAVAMSEELRQIIEKCSHDWDAVIVALRDVQKLDWGLIQSTLARSERRVDTMYRLKQRYKSKKQEQVSSAAS